VRATYTDNVPAATGTLGGPATLALTGSASGFAPAWAFDATPDGTFVISSPSSNPASTALIFTLRNTGTLAGAVPARSISGPYAGDYAITGGTCASQTLAPDAICTVQVTFTATDNVSNRTATLAAGGASKTLTGSASGVPPACVAGNAVISATGAGTFTRPDGAAGCAFRVLLVGGGGGGFVGDPNPNGPIALAGSGGGSGEVAQLTFAAGTFPASVSYSVGAGAPGRTVCGGALQRGGSTVFGNTTVLGGTTAGVLACNPLFGTFAGTGASSGGNRGQDGGAGGALVPGSGASPSQGTDVVSAALAGFTQRTVTSAAGGLAGTAPGGTAARGGGGAGGVSISGAAPAVAATAGGAVGGTQAGRPGGGFGAGGGGSNVHSHSGIWFNSGPPGDGASGVIYVEWSAP
jgi:hypothetical protein